MQGLKENTVKLENSDGRSRKASDVKRRKLKKLFGAAAVEAIHVGSTAVKGVKARPVTDIMIAVSDIAALNTELDALRGMGFTERPAPFGEKILCFVGEELKKITSTVYIVEYKSSEYWSLINFRDYLNVNSMRKKEYEDLKTLLSQRYPDDASAYIEGKRYFTEKITDEAKVWRAFSRSVSVDVSSPLGETLSDGRTRRLNAGSCDRPLPDASRPDAVYVMGENKPVKRFTGRVIAVLYGKNPDGTDREVWVAAPSGRYFFKPDIEAAIENDDGGEYRYICLYDKSCGAVVYFMKDGEPLYLLIKNRSQNMGFPKGHVERGENEQQTALREVKEETNLFVTLENGFREYYSYTINFCRKKQAVYFLAKASDGKIIVPKNEILSYSVVSYKDAVRLLSHNNERMVLRNAHEYIKNKRSAVNCPSAKNKD